MISALILAHVLTSNAITAQQPILLRYKFQAGQSRRYKMNMNSDMHMIMGAQKMPMKMTMNYLTKTTIKSVQKSGSALVSVDTLSQDMHMNMNGKDTKYPTPTAKGPVTLTMSPLGTVSGLNLPKSAGNPMAMMGGGGGAAGSLQITGALPSKPVSPGSHWASSTNIMGSNFQMDTKLDKFASVGGHTIAYITASGNLDLGKLLSMASKTKGVSGAGTMKGNVHYRFDVTNGCVLDVTSEMVFNMKMGTAQGNMDMTGVADMKMNLVQ